MASSLMKKERTRSGLTIVYDPLPTESVTVLVQVKTGSMGDPPKRRGLAHFIEHMLFEETQTRSGQQLANAVERLGGELNAETGHDHTLYYIKIPKSHLDVAFDILSDIILHPKFDRATVAKERQVIINEIRMIHDNARFYQFVLFMQTLFKHHPAQHFISGTPESVSLITSADLVRFHAENYRANNCIVSVVGEAGSVFSRVKHSFGRLSRGKRVPSFPVRRPFNTFRSVHEERQIAQAYCVLGYKTVPRTSSESYVFDVLRSHLGRGQSGRLFYEIRAKKGLCYEIGAHNEMNHDFGFFSVYFSCEPQHVERITRLVRTELAKTARLSARALAEAKTNLEGEFLLATEETRRRAELRAHFEQSGGAEEMDRYVERIQQVPLDRVKRVALRTFTNQYTKVVVGPRA